MPVTQKFLQILEAMEPRIIPSSLNIQGGEVKERPTMETQIEREMMTSEGLREVAILEDHQVVMIQMMVTTMRAAEMMTPQMVMATPYQAAVIPNIHRQT